MPTIKKRVNLTIPDEVYERIQEYKDLNGLENDATACLQLIVLQLNAQKQSKLLLDFIQQSSMDQLMQISGEGFGFVKQIADQQKQK